MIAATLMICLVMLGIMAAAWLVQRHTANGGWVDVFWSFGTGLCIAGAVLLAVPEGAPWRRFLLAGLIACWSLRLGLHIAARVRHGPEDVRYAAFRRRWGAAYDRRMLGLVLIQAPVSAILGSSVLIAARQPGADFGLLDGLGLMVLCGAMLGEATADRQMRRFKSDPANRGKVCDRGLWGLSRHPNYFFEALFWASFPVIAADPGDPRSFAAWLAPLVMAALLRYGSGVPPLEAAMLQSKGDAYRDYQQRVPVLVPGLGGKGDD